MSSVRFADFAVGALLAWWATYFTWGSGGQNRHVLSVSLVLLALAVIAVRPWEAVARPVCLLLGSVGVSAFCVAALAPTGWKGANEAASYLFASQLALVVLGWATDELRRRILLGAVLTAALFEFMQGFVQWWSSGFADKVFVGTFFWHNQTGIFLVMGAAVGLFALVGDVRQLAPLAWLAVPFCSAGVVFTTSRASQIALAGAFVAAVAAILVRREGRRVAAGKLLAVGAGALVLSQVLAGPPFFAQRVAAAVGQGSRHESFSQNGVYRLDFWRQAWGVFRHWPVTGAGFHSFASATGSLDQHRVVSSAFAHNGFLQLLSDGGLLLAVPVVMAVGAAFLVGARRVVGQVRAGEFVQPAAFVGFTLLLLHSGMDFDWSYPSLLAAAALLGALSVADLRTPAPMSRRASRTYLTATLGLLTLGVVAAWDGSILLNLPIAGTA